MSVSVSFYKNISEANVIDKTIGSALYTTYAELYDNTDILNPELKVAWNNNYVNTYNYLYIDEFKRYYFIDKVVAEPGGAARIKCSVDVLYTYKGSIKASDVFLTRAAQPKAAKNETYIKDTQYPLYLDKYVQTYQFVFESGTANPFNSNNPGENACNYVLNVMGRRGS